MLTQKQRRLFELIESGINDDGVCPSYEELRVMLGLSSKSSVHSMMNALENRGYIRRLRYKARAVEILKPSGTDHAGLTMPKPRRYSDVVYDIPVVGIIRAGAPVVAWESTHRYLTVPPAFAQPHGEHYALDIRGDSMIGAGIHEGDIAVIRRQSTAETGDIIVALVNGENTLKRLQVDQRRKQVTLIAESPEHEDIVVGRNELVVQGRLVSLLRLYDRTGYRSILAETDLHPVADTSGR